MPTTKKQLLLLFVFTVLLLVAAQCGIAAVPRERQNQPVTEDQRSNISEAEHESEPHADEHELEAVELAPVNLAEGEKLQVVATTSIVADIVRQVGGDLIDLTRLLPLGTDPHTFEPTPRDLAMVADAHVVFANGMGLEEFLDDVIDNAGGEIAAVHLSESIDTRQLGTGEAHEHEGEGEAHVQEGGEPQHHDETHEHEFGEQEEEHHHQEGVDPHTWTTPVNAVVFVHNIEQALSALDPANAESYAANAEAYEAELEALDEWVKAQIKSIPPENRELVTDHAVFGYYADRYGLEQIGAVIPSFSTSAEPAASELAALQDAIKNYDVKTLFVGTSVNPSLSQRLAEDTGTELLTLYTGSLGVEGSGVESYVDYIKYNTNTIVEGLK